MTAYFSLRASAALPAMLSLAIAYALLFPVLSFGLESVSGYVRNEPGDNPVAGAMVVALWEESSGGFGEGACPWIAVATTDSRGRYEIAVPNRSFFQGLFTSVRLEPYKMGYVFSPVSWNKKDPRLLLDMVTVGDSKQGQLRAISQASYRASRCLQVPMQQAAKMIPFYRTLLSDAMSLGADVQDPALLRSICSAISSVSGESDGAVGATPVFVPGIYDPQEIRIFSRVEPRCVPIMETPPLPPVHKVLHPNPSGSASTAPVNPQK